MLKNDDHAQGKTTEHIINNAGQNVEMEKMREAQEDKHENPDAHQHLRTARATDITQNTIDTHIQNQYLHGICEFNL